MSNKNLDKKFKFGPGDLRKVLIVAALFAVFFFKGNNEADESFYWALGSLVFIYVVDVFYTIIVTPRNGVELKAFIFQTIVPLFALSITCLVAILKSVDSSALVTMFGLSLAYTTYVVGKPIQEKNVPNKEAKGSE